MSTKSIRRLGDSTLVKLLALGFLVLLMLIPVAQVTGLVRERMARQQGVQTEIANLWGPSQTLLGPVLTVPFVSLEEEVTVKQGEDGVADTTVERTQRKVHHRLQVLPTEIAWEGSIEPQIRHRGLFQVVVYEAKLKAHGTFVRPAWDGLDGTPDWSRAALSLGVSDVRGLQDRIELIWGDGARGFLPGTVDPEGLGGGIHAPVPTWQGRAWDAVAPGESIPFQFELAIRGSGQLLFLPAGEDTRVTLTSTWPDPGFTGAFLPAERTVSEAGFEASWQVPFFGRAYGQRWVDHAVEAYTLHSSVFGVDLVLPADAYQQTERSVKYAILFVLLTFGTFFLLELLSPVRLHAVQYLLVGFALVLFYVLLLAVAEHLGFGKAYILAAVAISILISAYARSILMSARWALILLACLGSLYGYLYVLLRLEDFALLLGAAGLFVALALVMRLTRDLDWHTLEFRGTGKAAPAVPG